MNTSNQTHNFLGDEKMAEKHWTEVFGNISASEIVSSNSYNDLFDKLFYALREMYPDLYYNDDHICDWMEQIEVDLIKETTEEVEQIENPFNTVTRVICRDIEGWQCYLKIEDEKGVKSTDALGPFKTKQEAIETVKKLN